MPGHADPPFFFNSSHPDCPVGDKCRFSDAALFKYDAGITWDHGRIAIPSANLLTVTGFRKILGAMDMFRTPELFVGKTVQKTGRTTGITSGTITGVCVRARQYTNNNPTDRVMLCQAQATYTSGGGDSGAPVYMLKTGTSDIEVLIGLHWGTAFVWPNTSGVLRATFSDWYWVTSELANVVGAGGWLDPEFGACQGCGY